MTRRSSLRALLVAMFAVFCVHCTTPGKPPGAPCTRASECDSVLCLQTGGAGRCATKCEMGNNAACANGDVCGRFDFRAINSDSGMREGDPTDILYVCRPKLNATCDATHPCPSGTQCLGAPGICTPVCNTNAFCASQRCVDANGNVCGQGLCAPQCDAVGECPAGWYCDQSTGETLGHGRCAPTFPNEDAGCAPRDAAADGGDASASDSASDSSAEAGDP